MAKRKEIIPLEGDKDLMKSTSGFIIKTGCGPISWGSKIQALVATSTTEAESITTVLCAKNLIWF